MDGRSHLKLWLLLLRSRREPLSHQRGFSMVAVILVLLVAMVGSMGFALRSSSSLSGGLAQSASRQAQDAAETGITTLIGELNKPRNRRLLVSGTSPANWGSDTDIAQRNPCINIPETGAPSAPIPPSPTLADLSNSTWKAAGGSGQYVLRRVRYANRDRSKTYQWRYNANNTVTGTTTGNFNNNDDREINLDPVNSAGSENIGYLELEVAGRVIRNNTTIATATVVKEYEVIPKCCNRSFSGPSNSTTGAPLNSLGNDERACNSFASLGLIFGFNGGTITAGSNIELYRLNPDGTNSNTLLDKLVCIGSPSVNCRVTQGSKVSTNVELNTSPKTQIPILSAAFKVLPPPSFPFTTQACSTTSNQTSTSCPTNTNSAKYLRLSANNNFIEMCEITTSNQGVESLSCGGNNTLDYCAQSVNPQQKAIADFHCKLPSNQNLAFNGNRALYIETSPRPAGGNADPGSGRIAFYLDNNTTLDISNPIVHRFCPIRSTGSTPCPTNAPPSQFTRLSFLGTINTSLASDVNLNTFKASGNGSSSSFFVYLPSGLVSLSGSGEFSGSVWTKNLELSGKFISASPANNCRASNDGFCYLARAGTIVTGNGGASSIPIFDWIARSVVSTRVY